MFNYTLPLLLEEQAAMLLWEKVQPHIKDSIESYTEVQKAIQSATQNLADNVRREDAEGEDNGRPN